jgi:hypothetical protein
VITLFEAFQAAAAPPLHKVAQIDARPPWEADLSRMRFLCRMCRKHFTGTELADDDWHVFVFAPTPGWEWVKCVVCDEVTVPTVENSSKCDYCNGLQWWKPMEVNQ